VEGGQPLSEFLDDFPTVSHEAAVAALEMAKNSLVGQLDEGSARRAHSKKT
jgi:uncharacterized protein (DUF433 family)